MKNLGQTRKVRSLIFSNGHFTRSGEARGHRSAVTIHHGTIRPSAPEEPEPLFSGRGVSSCGFWRLSPLPLDLLFRGDSRVDVGRRGFPGAILPCRLSPLPRGGPSLRGVRPRTTRLDPQGGRGRRTANRPGPSLPFLKPSPFFPHRPLRACREDAAGPAPSWRGAGGCLSSSRRRTAGDPRRRPSPRSPA